MERSAASAASTDFRRPRVTDVPYGMREARQGAAGLSQVRRPSRRDIERMSALVKPASTRGKTAPFAWAARCPGRWSSRSSRFTPSATVESSAAARSGSIASMSASLHQKHRSVSLRR